MAQWLRRGAEASPIADQDRKLRGVADATLATIEKFGDAAVCELSVKFDRSDRDGHRF